MSGATLWGNLSILTRGAQKFSHREMPSREDVLSIITDAFLSVERGASDLTVALLSENNCIFMGGS